MPPTAPLGHRPELDGLRAIAVLVVALFHTKLGVARGGWVGVDVFFVLSGFLITTLLLEERGARGRVDLRAFYARRALRLLPALAVLLACLAVLVAVGAAGSASLGGAPWVIGYVANWAFALEEPFSPLVHLWSLSVEEQFYVVWPLMLLGLVRLAPSARRQLAVVGAVTVTVMVARTVLVLTDTVSTRRAYFGSDLRADALLLGCLLGIAHHTGWTVSMAAHLRRLAWPAVAVLAVAVVAAPSPFDEIGPLAYVPVDVASFVVIGAVVALPQRWAALSWPPLVRVGVLSYGVYLWHLPLMFVFAMAPLTRLLVAIPASIAIAAISHRVVEAPALRWKRRFEPATAVQPVGVVAA